MSIKKRVQNSLLFISVASIAILTILSLVCFFNIRSGINEQMTVASEKISTNNTHDMLSMSEQLASAIAQQNALMINKDFARIKGELVTLKGDIESLYRGSGLQDSPTTMNRYEEYIVSQAATLSQAEIDETVRKMSGITGMFDHALEYESKLSFAYVVMENGMVFSSTDTFYPEVEKTDMRTRNWYKNAVLTRDLHWADLYKGSDGDNYITAAIPVALDGNIWGVVAFDLRVNEISDSVLYQEGASFTDAFIMTNKGTLLLSTKPDDETVLSDAYKAITKDANVFTTDSGCYQSESIIAGYSTIEETGWKLVNLLNYNQMLEPVKKAEETVSSASSNMKNTMTRQVYNIIELFIILFVVLIVITALASRKVAKRITSPLMKLNDGVKIVASGRLDHFIEIRTGDEIETLASSFNKMTSDLLTQMVTLKSVTAEKERISTELNVATHIQASMLPCIFPAFPGRPEFDIYATMQPAKEVGGDFYDFFLVDDNHLAMVMADVSGKGVPAALFMVIAKTLIKNVAQSGMRPKDVLEKVNVQLCENNSVEMFVTVWLGIVEISSGKMICANAGHEFPAIQRAGGDFELIHDKHGFVLAGMETSKYREYEMKLEIGDRLFVYTDGVPEATNGDNELFGNDRMMEMLNKNKSASCENLLHNIMCDLEEFVGEAPQFDDITMLSFEMKEI